MTRQAWAPTLAATLLLSTCQSKPHPPEEPAAPTPHSAEEIRRNLLDAMVRQDHCYMSNLEYAIRDPDFLDRVLSQLLGQATLEQVAADPKEFEQLVREAPDFYTKEMFTKDGLLRLARLVEARFSKPVVTVTGNTVTADYGHIGAVLMVGRRNQIGIDFYNSPHIDEAWEWRTPEIAAALSDLNRRYPGAVSLQLRVLIPGGLRSEEWIYSYHYKVDRVNIRLPGPPSKEFYSDVIHHDFGPFLRGEATLDTKMLHSAGYN